ncbi:hypothetical protein HN695_08190 [Candidatus Woesearchaeota archaeon]|jgi:Icc-related predicted phosphoesterase|nr:hypothetical protein [Candidatus Woesearchaeota archaeon]MBT5271969.1 hypothetical protein [Candidatus Woesearchaeota archaeon]MBT6041079.1 hypothetical protein [Candidatus Woesearchaeota archaeon]MBT6337373.1 hypothetical protein [Candidatus Woesearchaeota archaeon]MBT7928283.1 hypothetical protein [Candidatus Woesearchaeota archaeon]
MRIAAISDIHRNKSLVKLFTDSPKCQDVDVLLICGDISNGNIPELEEILSSFSDFNGEKLFVTGNHDIWSNSEDANASMVKYEHDIPIACENAGFHCLDNSPKIIGDIGFVGNIGWYDYSFKVLCGSTSQPLHFSENRIVRRWEELNDDDYQQKMFLFMKDKSDPSTTFWGDKLYAKLGCSDKEFLERTLAKLKSDIEQINRYAKSIVAVTHHIPYEAIVPRRDDDVSYSLCNAYMGSKRIGELFDKYEKIRTVICGHSHTPGSFQINGKNCFNVSSENSYIKLIDIK